MERGFMLSAVSGLYKKTICIFCSLTSLVEFLTYLMLTRLKKKEFSACLFDYCVSFYISVLLTITTYIYLCICNKYKYIYINIWDQYECLGNCPPTPPLTQQQSIDNKLGLMLTYV